MKTSSAEPLDGPPRRISSVTRIIGEKYELGAALGEGGAGIVYQARHTWTDRAVAVKLLHPEVAADGDAVERFLREAKAMGRLRHENVVEVLDMGQEEDGSLFLVMDLLSGFSLGELKLPLSEQEALAIAIPLADGIAAAHAEGVIHRDLKPDNVMLVRDRGRRVPKLIDFGIAQTENSDSPMWQSKVLGTACYMSPEQVVGNPLTPATDVWSFGICLYELLGGTVPVEEETAQATIEAIAHGPPPNCKALPVARELSAVLQTMFRKDAKRPTIAEIATALREYAETLEGGLAMNATTISTDSTPLMVELEDGSASSMSAPAGPRKLWIAAVLALVVGAAAIMLARTQSPPDPTPVVAAEPSETAAAPVAEEVPEPPEPVANEAAAEAATEPEEPEPAEAQEAAPVRTKRRTRMRRAPGRTGSLSVDDF